MRLLLLLLASPALASEGPSSGSLLDAFSQYGLPGLIILFGGFGAYKVIRLLFDLYNKRTEQLIEFGPRNLDVIRANTVSQDSSTDAIRANTDAIRALGDLYKARGGNP